MIHCENLTKRFGHFTAVDRVSFRVAKGSIFGFLGPNGSGKSTVIRMLCGLLEPSEGRATIAGYDVARQTDRIKQVFGVKVRLANGDGQLHAGMSAEVFFPNVPVATRQQAPLP